MIFDRWCLANSGVGGSSPWSQSCLMVAALKPVALWSPVRKNHFFTDLALCPRVKTEEETSKGQKAGSLILFLKYHKFNPWSSHTALLSTLRYLLYTACPWALHVTSASYEWNSVYNRFILNTMTISISLSNSASVSTYLFMICMSDFICLIQCDIHHYILLNLLYSVHVRAVATSFFIIITSRQ